MEEKKDEKVVEVTTETAAPVVETKTDEVKTDDIDYKAELERSQKRLAQAEHTIVALKQSNKKSDDTDSDEDDEKVSIDTAAEIEKIKELQKQEFDRLKKDLVKNTVDEIVGSLSSNPDERALIKFNYENRIVPSGADRDSILNDLVAAQLIANRSKLEKTIKEMGATINSEVAKNKSGNPTGQVVETKTVKLTDAEEAFVKNHSKRTGIGEDVVRKKLIQNRAAN